MSSDKNCFLTGETCRINRIGQRERKKTEEFGRQLREILVKKGYEEGGVSLQRAYRKLIRILDDWYRKGIQIIDSQHNTTRLKMLKKGFRGERKGIGTRPQATGNRREYDGKSKETSPFYTYPAVAGYLQRGNVMTEKGKI